MAHRTQKHILAGVLLVLMVGGLAGCSLLTPSRADVVPEETLTKLTTPTIATKGVLTVGLTSDDAPQVMTDTSGQLTGYAVDVARALGQQLGLDVEFVTDAKVSETGSTGAPDIYLGATADDSDNNISVSGDFLEDAPAIFTTSANSVDATGTVTVETLSGATIAVQDGSATQDLLSKCGISAEQVTFSNINDCLSALNSGEVQYAACDATSGGYLSRMYDDIVFVGTIDSVTTYGVAVRTTNTDLAQAITDALSELSTDGTLDAIHVAWYGRLPVSLADTAISGITTSAERAQAEAAAAEAEEAESEATDDTSTTTDDGTMASADEEVSGTGTQ